MTTGIARRSLLGVFASGAALAQTDPRPIRVIIPFAPGGPLDVLGRPLLARMGEATGQSFVIDNRAGASGMIGAEAVARARPDGTTLLLHTSAFTGNVAAGMRMPFDPLRDFAPISQIASTFGVVLLVRGDSPWRSVADLLAAARARPGALSYGHAGAGSITHVAGELFKQEARIDLITVPFRGSAPAVTEVIAANIAMTFAALPTVVGQIREGALRPLAFTGAARVPALPDVPTLQQAGFPDFDVTSWYGLWAPAGTAPDRLRALRDALAAAMTAPEMRRVIEETGVIPVASTPEDFSAFLPRDIARQAALQRRLNLEPASN